MAFETETKRLEEIIKATESDQVVGWIHDRTDPDSLGFVALAHILLRERFGKAFNCYYSKKITFLVNRHLAKNFIPAGVLLRVEENPDHYEETLAKAALILVGDTSNPEIVAGLNRYLKSDDYKSEAKPIVFLDHHEKVPRDLEDIPSVTGIRAESAQATSALMVHIMRNLGVELNGEDETQLKAAVAAKIGIEIDLIGYAESEMSDSVKEANEYLDEVLGERGEAIIKKLRQIKVAQGWYVHLANAQSYLPLYSTNLAVCGLGVLDDNGILPFVANELMRTGYFNSIITFGIVYDQLGQRFADLDLEASGRSRANQDISLPDLFAKVFYYTDAQGRRISRGGGRTSALLGERSDAGASIPLKYWMDMTSFSVDTHKRLLQEHAWPVEFERIRTHLLAAAEIRSDQIIDTSRPRGANGTLSDDNE